MASPIQNFIETPVKTRIEIGLAPVQNAIHSLLLLTQTEYHSGFGGWVVETEKKLSVAERKRHYQVMIGFYHAIAPERNWSNFQSYLDHLAAVNPNELRNKLINRYLAMPAINGSPKLTKIEEILESEEKYIDFLGERFPVEKIDKEMEKWAYGYVTNPPALKELIVNHLQKYWDAYLSEEWDRVLPTLQKSVIAYQNVDYSQMDNFEAAKFIIGDALDKDVWENKCRESKSIFFAPSLHVGPYLGKMLINDVQGFIYGARLPEETAVKSPELNQMDIYIRLNALADETRLQILKHVATNAESCSAEITNDLELSQSATSRHLSLLTATGYLTSRRNNGAKCYRIDNNRINNSLDAIKDFLKLD